MVVLWVWVAVVVLAVVVLGAVGYGVVGALTRLRREVEAAQRDLEPVLEQLQAIDARPGGTPGSGTSRA